VTGSPRDPDTLHRSVSSPRLDHLRIRDARRHDALLRACWRFRLRFVDLQPHITPEADWQAFRAYFEPDVNLEVYRDRGAEIRAMFAWSMRQVDCPDRPRVVIDADYGFVDPALRRRIGATLFPQIWLRAAWAGRSPVVTVLGAGYPSGVMSFGRVARRIRSLADPDLEPWERRLLHDHCAHADCIDPARGLLRMRTRPREPRREPRGPRSRALLAWYEAQVPRWQDGEGLADLVRFDPLHLLRGWLFGA